MLAKLTIFITELSIQIVKKQILNSLMKQKLMHFYAIPKAYKTVGWKVLFYCRLVI